MATKEEEKMYNLAISRVKDLEKELAAFPSNARGEELLERRLEAAITRLEKLEMPVEKVEKEEDDDTVECPICGHILGDPDDEDGTRYCASCENYFEDDE